MNPEFGNRMKRYEEVFKTKLVPHVPVICRIDGKAFHTYTKAFERPFDKDLHYAFTYATRCLYMEGVKYAFAYGQSDEVSLLIYSPSTFSQEMFNGETAKLNSVIASIFTANFNNFMFNVSQFKEVRGPAYFDCRVYNIPESEIVNYFIWRQLDASRNSVSMLGRCHFSHKQLEHKSCSEIQDMLWADKGINWNDQPTTFKRGYVIERTEDGVCMNEEIPIFTQDKDFLIKKIPVPDLDK